MGYEVLDAGDDGRASTRAAGSVQSPVQSPVESPVEPLEPVPLEAYRTESAAPQRRSRAERARAVRARLSGQRGRLVALTAAALVVGAVAGSRWSEQREREVRAAERRNVVQVTAITDSSTRQTTGRGTAVDVVVRLFNAGPLPVEVVESFDETQMTTERPVVHSLAGSTTVTREHDLAVSVSVLLDCSSTEPLRLTVPVRSADGELHQVAVRRGPADPLVPRALCLDDAPSQDVRVELVGTLAQPFLRFSNLLKVPVRIYLDPGSPITQSASEVVVLRSEPRLPLLVPAGGGRQVSLRVDAPACTRDLDEIQAAGGFGGVGLVAEAQGDVGPTARSSTPLYVDLSALVGAALERACA